MARSGRVHAPAGAGMWRGGDGCWHGWGRRDAGAVRGAARRSAALRVMHTDSEVRYDRFDPVLTEIKRAGITQQGLAGSGAVVE